MCLREKKYINYKLTPISLTMPNTKGHVEHLPFQLIPMRESLTMRSVVSE